MVVLDERPPFVESYGVVERLRNGPLGRQGGVTVLDGFPSRAVVAALAREALTSGAEATRQIGPTHVVDDGRHDVAGRVLGSGPGGPVQDALYASTALHARLGAMCGVRVKPTGRRGSFSYYTRPGDHLDTHVDVVACDVTLITVVQDSTPAHDQCGGLAVFSDHIGAPLSAVRDTGAVPTAVIKAPRGSSVVILGGLVPHRVVPLGATGTRVVSALCFEAVA